MNTALILRPANAPQIRVLEVDGPRRKYVQRGEGSYYLNTNNHRLVDDLFLNAEQYCPHYIPHLIEEFDAWWEIYQMNDGTIEVHACRPTEEEAIEGDLNGALGSVIKLRHRCKTSLRNAMRLARQLLRCDPALGIIVSDKELAGIYSIESDIPVSFASCFDSANGDNDEQIVCWCGAKGTEEELFSTDSIESRCGGSGVLNCFCGGDFCVCHHHGETECLGCPDCEELDDDDYEH